MIPLFHLAPQLSWIERLTSNQQVVRSNRTGVTKLFLNKESRTVFNSLYSSFLKNGVLLLCLAMLGWAGNTIAGRISTGEISPMVVVFLRWFIISIFLILFLNKKLISNLKPIRRKFVWLGLMGSVSYTHLRAHETDSYLVCRLLLEKKKQN